MLIYEASWLVCDTYVLVCDGFGHERDSQDEEDRDDKQDDGEVQVVDSTYDGGAVGGINAAACAVSELSNHPGQAYNQANHQAIKGTLTEEKRHNHIFTAADIILIWIRISQVEPWPRA